MRTAARHQRLARLALCAPRITRETGAPAKHHQQRGAIMAHSLFVCGIDQEAGSSVVALGLGGVLRRTVREMAFFKPVGAGANDPDVAVFKAAHGIADQPDDVCPVRVEEARDLVAHGHNERLLERINQCYLCRLAAKSPSSVEGINNQTSMNVTGDQRGDAAHLRDAGAAGGAGQLCEGQDQGRPGAGGGADRAAGVPRLGRDVSGGQPRQRRRRSGARQKFGAGVRGGGRAALGVLPCLTFLSYPAGPDRHEIAARCWPTRTA
ncbi:MAG: AAA family ATPase [Phycisphaerales bacterium]|nr:AAA family ATPase [Phycisphaerales bacterium]